jgi:excisionase family DNA binding protein
MGLDEILVTKLAEAISMQVVKQLAARIAELPTKPAPALMTVKDAAVYLGRSQQSIQHLIADGQLPVVRVGRRVHLHRADLDRWIEKNKF